MKKMLTEWRQFLKEQEMSQEDFRKIQVGKYAEVMKKLFAEDQALLKGPDAEHVRGTLALEGFTTFIGMVMKIQPDLDVEKMVEMYKNDDDAVVKKTMEILPQIVERYDDRPEDYFEDLDYVMRLKEFHNLAASNSLLSMERYYE
jgi:hypothetical protein